MIQVARCIARLPLRHAVIPENYRQISQKSFPLVTNVGYSMIYRVAQKSKPQNFSYIFAKY